MDRERPFRQENNGKLTRQPSPGVPIAVQKVHNRGEIEPGDHLLCQDPNLPQKYRPIFQSSLVIETSKEDNEQGIIWLLTNNKDGVKKKDLPFKTLPKPVYKVIYAPAMPFDPPSQQEKTQDVASTDPPSSSPPTTKTGNEHEKEELPSETLSEPWPGKVIYTPACRYSNEEAIKRATHRSEMNESRFNPLYNNSHFFVTLAKTGVEYPLVEITESLVNIVLRSRDKDAEYMDLKPVLKKVPLQSHEEIQRGDHLMIRSKHWLVAEKLPTDDSFEAYSYDKEVISKRLRWKKNIIRLEYDTIGTPLNPEAITKAKSEYERKTGKWKTSEQFVTSMKCGTGYLFNKSCLISAENVRPVSCTRITPDIAIDRGDHLVIRLNNGSYHSILVYEIISGDQVLAITGLDPDQTHQCISISNYDEVHRVNYKECLPSEEVLERAASRQRVQLLDDSLCDTSLFKFATWAKTGTSMSISQGEICDLVQRRQQQILHVRPTSYRKVINLDKIQVGDHLFHPYKVHEIGYNWHFMVTEKNIDHSDDTRMRVISCLRGRISEEDKQIDPTKMSIYHVEYFEQLPVKKAIEKARSQLGVSPDTLSPWFRTEFVRWAKTGSEEGLEIDFLMNKSMPNSMSRIWSFSQLEPGDYLMEDQGRYSKDRHYLVKSVESPTKCTVIQSWRCSVSQSSVVMSMSAVDQEKTKYYRMNYDPRGCLSVELSIKTAEQLSKNPWPWRDTSSSFVNFVKTTEKKSVEVKTLQDTRKLLRRKKVTSVKMLQPGDHLECELAVSDEDYHHMFVTAVDVSEGTIDVIQYGKKNGCRVREIHEAKINLSHYRKPARICYPDRILPHDGERTIRSRIGEKRYNLVTNNCEHLVMQATTGYKMSIQVEKGLRKLLFYTGEAIVTSLVNSPIRNGAKGLATTSIKVTARAATVSIAKAAGRAAARSTVQTSVRGAIRSAETATVDVVITNTALTSFRVGREAFLNGTAVGLAGGVNLGVNILVEAPLFMRSVYKLHRKRKFDMISSRDYACGVTRESIISVSTVALGVIGTVVGQAVIPVPVLGGVIGGGVGTLVGRGGGHLVGRSVGKVLEIVIDKHTKAAKLPVIVRYQFFSLKPDEDVHSCVETFQKN